MIFSIIHSFIYSVNGILPTASQELYTTCVVHTLVNKMDLGPFLSSYSCQSIREKTAECCDKGSFGMGERFQNLLKYGLKRTFIGTDI